MSYTNVWDESRPNGAIVAASSIDTEIQAVKIDIRERMNTVFGSSVFATADPFKASKLLLNGAASGQIVAGTGSGLAIRNAADSASTFVVSDVGVVALFNNVVVGSGTIDLFSSSVRGGVAYMAGLNLANAANLAFRDAGNTVNITVLTVDASNNTILNAQSGKSLFFASNSINQWQVNLGGHLTPTLNNALDIGSPSQIVNPRNIYAETSVRTPVVGPLTAIDFFIQQAGVQTWKFSALGNLQPVSNNVGDIGQDNAFMPLNIYAGAKIRSRGNIDIISAGVNPFIGVFSSEAQFGSASAHAVNILVNGVNRWLYNTSGHQIPVIDDTYDLGNSTHTIKDLYVKGKTYLGSAGTNGYTWPSALPSIVQFLSSDSAGNLSWGNPSLNALFYAGKGV